MPTGYIPTFEIYKGGENITARFQDRALSITVKLAAGSGDQDSCEITVDDRDWLIANPSIGDRLEVRLGYEGVGLAYMGSFEVNKIRYNFPPKTISVIGTAATSLSEIKSQKVNSFSDKTVEQILAEFGSQIGMKADVHKDIADQKIPFLNNNGVSFGGLISRLEARYGAVAKIMDGRVALSPRGAGQSVSDFSMPTYVFEARHFAELEVFTESSGEYKKTIAKWRDPTTHEMKTVESATKLAQNKSEAEHKIGREWASELEAQAAADAVQGQLDRSTGKISAALAQGDPWLRDGQRILITRCRSGINGSYLVDMVQHAYAKNKGLTTTFTGSAGTDGLLEDFAAAPSTSPDFIAPLPGQFFGQVMPVTPLQLNQQNSSTPSLVVQPSPRP